MRSFVLLSQRSDRLCHLQLEWSLRDHGKLRCLSPPVNSSRIFPSSLSNSPAASWPKRTDIEFVFSFGANVRIFFSELRCRLQLSSPQLADWAAHVEPLILDRASQVVFAFLPWPCGWYRLIDFARIAHMGGLEQHIKLVTVEPSLRRPPIQLAARYSCSFPSALARATFSPCWTCRSLC